MDAFARSFRLSRFAISLSAVLALALGPIQGSWPQHVGSHSPIGPTLASGLEAPPDRPPASPETGSSCGGSEGPDDLYLHSGEVQLSAVDMRIPGVGLDVVIARKYRSNGPSTALGHGWDFSYNLRIEAEWTGIRVHDGNTRSDLYTPQPNGKYAAAGFFREGELNLDGSFTLTFADGGTWTFRPLDASPAAGRIASIADRNGNALGFGYDGLGRLVTVTDALGRDVALGYDADGYLASVTDWTGREVRYEHYQDGDAGGAAGDLKSVRTPLVTGTPNGNDFPAGKTTVYTYSKGFASERLNHNLLTVTDPKGQTSLTNVYATTQNPRNLSFDRVVKQVRGGAGDTLELVYLRLLPAAPGDPALRVIANDPVGNVREYFYDAANRLVMRREFTGRADPGQPTTATANRPVNPLRPDDPAYFETRWEHNADSLVTRVVHPSGNETRRVYELALDPLAARRARGNLRELRRLPGTHLPAGDQAELVDLYEYDPDQGSCGCGTSRVTRHTDARGNVTEHDYDARGNRVRTIHRIPSLVEDFEHDGLGQLTAHVWPDNGSGYRRRDELRYYGPADGAQNGYLKESVVDAQGLALTTTFEYDAVGNVVREIDPRGNDRLHTHNALNQVVRELSPAVGSVRYEKLLFYDANDNLARVDVENLDENGAPQANTHFTTAWTYGVLNERLSEAREVEPGVDVVTEYAYDANRNRTLVRHPEAVAGNQPASTESTLYDERDLVFREIRAQGAPEQSTTQRDWDRNGNAKAAREGLESEEDVTQHLHDGYDRLVSVTDPMGNATEHDYDAAGNLVGTQVLGELVDVAGSAGNVRLFQASYQYDAMDRRIVELVEHFDPATQAPIGDGQSTRQMTWSGASQVLAATDDNGNTTSFAYDGACRLAAVTDAKGNSLAYGYDAGSKVISTSETDLSDLGSPDQSFTTSSQYDALDRLLATTDSSGNTTAHRYDSRGNRTRLIDVRSQHTCYEYDGLSRLVRTSRDMDWDGVCFEAVDINTELAWNDNSLLSDETDDSTCSGGSGNTALYTYDPLDRRVAIELADGTVQEIEYDAHDDPVRITDRNGTCVDSLFDALGRATSRTVCGAPVPGTTFEAYEYDGLSRLTRAEDDDSVVTRAYDSLSNILRETQQVAAGPVRSVIASYDGEGNQTRLVYPGGRTIARTFDAVNLPDTIRDEAEPLPSTIAEYAYVGRRVERRDYGNGMRCEYGYDGITGVPNPAGDSGVRRVVRLTHSVAATGIPFVDRRYIWDRNLNKTRFDDLLLPETRVYAYDAVNRLVSSDWSPGCGSPTAYSYDDAGNRTAVSGCLELSGPYTMDPTLPEPADCQVNQYTSTPVDDRGYDRNGNLTVQTPPGRSMEYDYRNQLVRVTEPAAVTREYRYDCLGRRIEKDVGGTVTRFYCDGFEEIEEQDGAGATVATYVYSKGPASRLEMTSAGQRFFLHGDDQGSTVAVTDAAGQVLDLSRYRDFGAPLSSGSAHSQPADQRVIYDSDSDAGPFGTSFIGEDFTLHAATQISAIAWWGGYDYAPGTPSVDNFVISIFADDQGLPGQLLCQELVGNDVGRTATGNLVGAYIGQVPEYAYQATLQSPFLAQPGVRYWVVIVDDTTGHAGTWGWETSSQGNGVAAAQIDFSSWQQFADDQAFELIALLPSTSGNPYGFNGLRHDLESDLYFDAGLTIDASVGQSLATHPAAALGSLVDVAGVHAAFANNPGSVMLAVGGGSLEDLERLIQQYGINAAGRQILITAYALGYSWQQLMDLLRHLMESKKYGPGPGGPRPGGGGGGGGGGGAGSGGGGGAGGPAPRPPVPPIPVPWWRIALPGPGVAWIGVGVVVGTAIGAPVGLGIEHALTPEAPKPVAPAGCDSDDRAVHVDSDWYWGCRRASVMIELKAEEYCKKNTKCSGTCADKAKTCKPFVSVEDTQEETSWGACWYTIRYRCLCGCK